MNHLKRDRISDLIYNKIKDSEDVLKKHFESTEADIGYFFIDNLLPETLAKEIFRNFPSVKEVSQKKSLKEYKYVAAQMNRYHPLLEEVIYAFQDTRVVNLISEICDYENIYPDEKLYAGGISMMGKGNYLNPHLDNSHDKDRERWRVLNLLYYVTPNWNADNGGNLELWPKGIKKDPLTVDSKFNRLVVMATHTRSWHSVSRVEVDTIRCCVSNYYFSEVPVDPEASFHVTTFRGRPGEYIKNLLLRMDSTLRMGVRKLFKKGIRENPHFYKKDDK